MNGYIDDEAWFGDEITPEALHGMLYPEGEEAHGDLRIFLNSYGGSCNAAVRMFDDLRAYPGSVHIIVSGTAASAATVLAMAADRLEMTPGSLWMIHDPGVMVWGNERDLEEAVRLLKACKESILNVYGRRCRKARDEIGAMMRDTTWMDAGQALQDGFIDRIADAGGSLPARPFLDQPGGRPRRRTGWTAGGRARAASALGVPSPRHPRHPAAKAAGARYPTKR